LSDDQPTVPRSAFEELARERDYHRTLRQSWYDQWRRDSEGRLLAERDLAAARVALAHARDLLEAWTTCHEDPALRRRTEQIVQELEAALAPRDVW
jgi:hypothetical protein